jgi:hypothetical protein
MRAGQRAAKSPARNAAGLSVMQSGRLGREGSVADGTATDFPAPAGDPDAPALDDAGLVVGGDIHGARRRDVDGPARLIGVRRDRTADRNATEDADGSRSAWRPAVPRRRRRGGARQDGCDENTTSNAFHVRTFNKNTLRKILAPARLTTGYRDTIGKHLRRSAAVEPPRERAVYRDRRYPIGFTDVSPHRTLCAGQQA